MCHSFAKRHMLSKLLSTIWSTQQLESIFSLYNEQPTIRNVHLSYCLFGKLKCWLLYVLKNNSRSSRKQAVVASYKFCCGLNWNFNFSDTLGIFAIFLIQKHWETFLFISERSRPTSSRLVDHRRQGWQETGLSTNQFPTELFLSTGLFCKFRQLLPDSNTDFCKPCHIEEKTVYVCIYKVREVAMPLCRLRSLKLFPSIIIKVWPRNSIV